VVCDTVVPLLLPSRRRRSFRTSAPCLPTPAPWGSP